MQLKKPRGRPMTAPADQKMQISIRIPRSVHTFAQEQQKVLKAAMGIEPSLNAVLLMFVEKGVEAVKAEAAAKAGG